MCYNNELIMNIPKSYSFNNIRFQAYVESEMFLFEAKKIITTGHP